MNEISQDDLRGVEADRHVGQAHHSQALPRDTQAVGKMNFGLTHGTMTGMTLAAKGELLLSLGSLRSFSSPCRGGWSNPGVIPSEVTV